MSYAATGWSFFKKVLITLSILISIVAVAAAGFWIYKHPQPSTWLSFFQDPQVVAANELSAVIEAVSKVAVLPEEEPTLATVTDKAKLADQAFFDKAENGDQVLIFTEAKRAYLYRPSTKQIVEIAPLTIQDSAGTQAFETVTTPGPSASPVSSPVPSVSVSLYNGTTVAGLSSRYEVRLKAAVPEAVVQSRQNAVSTSYTESFVIEPDAPSLQAAARSLATKLGLPLRPLPEGEAQSSSSIAVILGTDVAEQ